MAYSIEDQRESPAVRLRKDLSEAERLVPQLSGDNIEHFLRLLDSIHQQFEQLQESGLDLRPEKSRQASIHSRLNRLPGDVVSAARKQGGLKKLREQNSPANNFWWHLDQRVTQQRQTTLRKGVFIVGTIVLVLGGLYLILQVFFPPDPEVVLISDSTSRLTDLAVTGSWTEAEAVIEQTEAQLSEPDAELLIWKGVVAEMLGQTDEANTALRQAQNLLGPDQRIAYWTTLGNVRFTAGNIEGARGAAERALALDPNAAQAYFLLGSIAEARGELPQAIENYDRTFELAIDSNPQLAVISRIRKGTLLQRGGPGSPTLSPEPTGLP